MRRTRKKYDGPLFDVSRPNNPNIPFFSNKSQYNEIMSSPPPSDSGADRDRVWLVEPGVQSIEIYEAILTQTLGHCPPLQKYICRAGLVQFGASRKPPRVIPGARDQGLREERDVCFTLLSFDQRSEVSRWMQKRGILMIWKPKIATPYGYMTSSIAPLGRNDRARICGELGFGAEDSDFPRSALPPGVIAQENMRIFDWCLPGEDGVARDGRATDDGEFVRIEWPKPVGRVVANAVRQPAMRSLRSLPVGAARPRRSRSNTDREGDPINSSLEKK